MFFWDLFLWLYSFLVLFEYFSPFACCPLTLLLSLFLLFLNLFHAPLFAFFLTFGPIQKPFQLPEFSIGLTYLPIQLLIPLSLILKLIPHAILLPTHAFLIGTDLLLETPLFLEQVFVLDITVLELVRQDDTCVLEIVEFGFEGRLLRLGVMDGLDYALKDLELGDKVWGLQASPAVVVSAMVLVDGALPGLSDAMSIGVQAELTDEDPTVEDQGEASTLVESLFAEPASHLLLYHFCLILLII